MVTFSVFHLLLHDPYTLEHKVYLEILHCVKLACCRGDKSVDRVLGPESKQLLANRVADSVCSVADDVVGIPRVWIHVRRALF